MLGAGGMGEVYRARDEKLGRDVAIKILSDPLTTDAAYLARFEREARILASLNHPHIGAIRFDESDGVWALVLEIVEGQTLAERLPPCCRALRCQGPRVWRSRSRCGWRGKSPTGSRQRMSAGLFIAI